MKESPKKKYSQKRKDEIILPGSNYIYQSNRITNGRFPDFNVYHVKIFVCLVKQLQTAIQADMDGKFWQQLGLFEEVDNNYLKVGIPLSEISAPQNYKEAIAAFADLRRIDYAIESPYVKGYITNSGLISEFDTPIKENGKSVVYVKLLKGVANDLITVAKNEVGKPISFTRYLYDVVMNSKSKYTWKIYTLISSWKSKGGFNIRIEKFRALLGLNDDEYLNYKDLKRRIIIPAQKELDHKADCWFNCSDKEFEEREGKKVVGLRFKVISPALEEVASLKKEQASNLLRMNFAFKPADLEAISGIFTPEADYGAILNKIFDLIEYIKLNAKEIDDHKRYMIVSLLKTFEKQF
jgi:hypothetical protein